MRQSVQQYLGVPEEWPVKEDIRHEIVLMPNDEDIRTAKKKDPLGCALHNAACRVYGIPNAAIGGRWAYIPQRDNKGMYYIARMQATASTQKAIQAFDKKGTMPKAGFTFKPIAPSHTYEKKRKYMKEWSLGLVGGNKLPRGKLKKRLKKTRTIPMNVRVA